MTRHTTLLLLPFVLAPISMVVAQDGQGKTAAIDALTASATQMMADDDWVGAAHIWSELIQLDPHHIVAHLNRATSYYASGNCAAGASDATHALELVSLATNLPDLERLVYSATALRRLGDFSSAIDSLNQAKTVAPDYAPAGILLSQVQRDQRNNKQVCTPTDNP